MFIDNTLIFPVDYEQPWFELQNGVKEVYGKFKKGQPEGKGHIRYEDGSRLEGTFIKGRMNGKVRLFNSNDRLLAVGLYRQGQAHGPFWIYSYDQDQFAQVSELST